MLAKQSWRASCLELKHSGPSSAMNTKTTNDVIAKIRNSSCAIHTRNLVSILMTDEFEEALCDVREHNFLVSFFLGQARVERFREGVNTLKSSRSLVAVLVEHCIQVPVRLCLLNLVGQCGEVDQTLNAFDQMR